METFVANLFIYNYAEIISYFRIALNGGSLEMVLTYSQMHCVHRAQDKFMCGRFVDMHVWRPHVTTGYHGIFHLFKNSAYFPLNCGSFIPMKRGSRTLRTDCGATVLTSSVQ